MTPSPRAATILIVDDNRDNLFVLDRLLTHEGHRVLTAEDGAEALSLAHGDQPDLVLMDLDMPVMDGFEASRRIRAIPDLAHVPILALSAHALLGDEERAMGHAIDGFISKPFSAQQLLSRVSAMLAHPAPRPSEGATDTA
jgi:two-component system cell cycle response regulator DivK